MTIHASKALTTTCRATPDGVERGVRERLATKVNGTYFGLWLLLPEYLRLGTWDRLCRWAGTDAAQLAPRVAFQLVNEAALCSSGVRARQRMCHKGFELANGLPWVAADATIHRLLDAHTVQDASTYQIALGITRAAAGHFHLQRVAIDPHRVPSTTQRDMVKTHTGPHTKPCKAASLFFALDMDTKQPVALVLTASAQTVSHVTPQLMHMVDALPRQRTLRVVADAEHCTAALLRAFVNHPRAELLTPAPCTARLRTIMHALPAHAFTRVCAGFAYATCPFAIRAAQPLTLLVQRTGERANDYHYKPFVTTAAQCDDALVRLVADFPDRWHIEEFFCHEAALGWQRAGTHTLNIRFNQMALALEAQAALFQLRQRLPAPARAWSAPQLAAHLFSTLCGDLHVQRDTLVVTLYDAPFNPALAQYYQQLPEILTREGVDPRIPWLCNFKLRFRFR